MKTGTKFALGALGVLALWKLSAFVRKAADIQDNIAVSPAFKGATIRNGIPYLTFSVTINNISGINLQVKNLFSKIYFVRDGAPIEIGFSGVEPRIDMKTAASVSFDTTFQISGITALLNAMKAQQIRIVTYYDFLGQRLQYSSDIEVKALAQGVKKFIGLGNPNVIEMVPGPSGVFVAKNLF